MRVAGVDGNYLNHGNFIIISKLSCKWSNLVSDAVPGSRERNRRLDRITCLFFTLTLAFIHLRAGDVILAHPAPPIYKDFTDFLLFSSAISLLDFFILWGSSLLITPRAMTLGLKFIWLPLLGLTFAGFISTVSSLDRSLIAEDQSF